MFPSHHATQHAASEYLLMLPCHSRQPGAPAPLRALRCHLHPSVLARQAGCYDELSDDVAGYFLDPMPVKDLLDTFLSPRDPPPNASALPVRPSTVTSATGFTFLLLERIGVLVPSLSPDPVYQLAPTLSFYKNSNRHSTFHSADFLEMELFAQVNALATDDRFSGSGDGDDFAFEHASGERCRGQLTAYAGALFASQFRTHAFSFLLFGEYARILRWDASGVIVTERFKHSDNAYLATSLWRFDGSSDETRGHDLTVSRLRNPWPVTKRHPVYSRDSETEAEPGTAPVIDISTS